MSKLIVENRKIDGIPLNEFYLEARDYRGLVFIQHGFTSKKERGTDYLALNFARLGYKVVSIDAFKHGERIEPPYLSGPVYQMFAEASEVVEHTAKDIKYLFDNYYKNDFKSFNMVGISLGGMIAYYLAMITDKIDKLVPVISTPMFTDITFNETEIEDLDKYLEIVEKKREEIEAKDPSKNIDLLRYNELFMLNGTSDNIIPKRHSEAFYEQFNNGNMTFKLYDVNHTVSKKMQEDILEFFIKEKVYL